MRMHYKCCWFVCNFPSTFQNSFAPVEIFRKLICLKRYLLPHRSPDGRAYIVKIAEFITLIRRHRAVTRYIVDETDLRFHSARQPPVQISASQYVRLWTGDLPAIDAGHQWVIEYFD